MITNPKVGQLVENRYDCGGETPAPPFGMGPWWYRCLGVRGVITKVISYRTVEVRFTAVPYGTRTVNADITRLVLVNEHGLCRAAGDL